VIRIVEVTSGAEVEAVRELLREYARWLDLDLSFQRFGEEMESLPGEYAPPHGVLLLALDGSVALGCVGLRPLTWPETAELKRLFVRPSGRGRQLGRLLSKTALSAARAIGYRRVRLDTLPHMAAAQHLYESLGFRGIEAYRFNPVPGTRYMEVDLNASDTAQ
jgi:ribosomal protein S18 acetylase RimI-like enzyme